jgi:anaerobic ribonucleoside-triphosphate reductase activating protein
MRVLTITTPDVENGLGNRVTIWFAGCSHRCVGCHNQHTWDYNQGTPLFDDGVIEKIFSEVDRDYIAGITLAGGDPFSQNDESLNELLKFVRMYKSAFPEKNIWIYSGATYESDNLHPIKNDILNLCDVMVDGPFIISLRNPDLAFRGSSNQRLIDLKKTREKGEVVLLDVK